MSKLKNNPKPKLNVLNPNQKKKKKKRASILELLEKEFFHKFDELKNKKMM